MRTRSPQIRLWAEVNEMKKRYFALLAVGVAACCLGGCQSKETPDELDPLSKMLKADYSQITITVTDTFGDNISLESVYAVTYSGNKATVNYVVEQFTQISLDNPTSDVKETLTGTAVVEHDTVSVEGDSVDIDFYRIAYPRLTFKSAYFMNMQYEDIYFIADVKDSSAFLGFELDCTNMSVTALFSSVFENIQINYTSEGGNEVNYTYIFTV